MIELKKTSRHCHNDFIVLKEITKEITKGVGVGVGEGVGGGGDDTQMTLLIWMTWSKKDVP